MAADGSMVGKRVVLTGGTDGIGKAAAIQLMGLGAGLTLMARRGEGGARGGGDPGEERGERVH